MDRLRAARNKTAAHSFRLKMQKGYLMKTILALIALALCTPALAADVPAKTTEFVDKVAVSNKFEIDTSQLVA